MVVYKSKMTHGRNKKNFAVMTATVFIAAYRICYQQVSEHLPAPPPS